MVRVTRLNGSPLVVNSEMIELIESTPDTVLTLTTGRKIVIREPVEEVVNMVKEYKRSLRCGPRLRGRRRTS